MAVAVCTLFLPLQFCFLIGEFGVSCLNLVFSLAEREKVLEKRKRIWIFRWKQKDMESLGKKQLLLPFAFIVSSHSFIIILILFLISEDFFHIYQ